jgi:hypothetical protein
MPKPQPRKTGKKKKKKKGDSDHWSIRKVAIALAIAIAFLGWAFCAADYAREVEGWQAGGSAPVVDGGISYTTHGRAALGLVAIFQALLMFLWNSIVQLPDLPFVAIHVLKNTIWLVVIFLLLEGLVVLFVWYDRKLNAEWGGTSRREPPPE